MAAILVKTRSKTDRVGKLESHNSLLSLLRGTPHAQAGCHLKTNKGHPVSELRLQAE
jgi:hypothetical protein